MTYTVMTVCTGNICRSPMAEVVLRKAFADAGLDVEVRSTAVTAYEIGNPIDSRARDVLVEAGFDVPARGAVQVTREDVATTDLALAMTGEHAGGLRRVGFPPEKVVLFRAFEDPELARERAAQLHEELAEDTPDPWFGDRDDFVQTLATIEACAPAIVDYVRARIGESAG
ncbi:low molecular weight protein-tyrosine-phosphatase [Litorihabitans aurantiacus]|uniref:protein-tyrosine-phosphatase n=1 Tax=Litorihabitans aurantiacus TaxID=1930061 RepID=A0AA38CV48_9MICO|nr:low molecular weight protein-tyrosine-phosphatase [Litorihabitans aurantiacus]GMA33279.1 phosphotyrosine protein phosphatase [Litorihabitans aurantiacus]